MLPRSFFVINFSIMISFSIIGISFSLLIIGIVVLNRHCRNLTNLLICNTCVAAICYFVFRIIVSIYGLAEDWQTHQPLCLFRAYISLTFCGAISYSYAIQAISRLFHTVFYHHRYLTTWRSHWILIMINWLTASVVACRPFFHPDGFFLELESRTCVINAQILSVSIYTVCMDFVIPFSLVITIYAMIFFWVRRSSRRVMPFVSGVKPGVTQPTTSLWNTKRELRLMRNMSIQANMIGLGGILYLIMVIWLGTQTIKPPESFYLLAVNLIAVATALMVVILFAMNKMIRDTVLKHLTQNSALVITLPPKTQQAITRVPVNS